MKIIGQDLTFLTSYGFKQNTTYIYGEQEHQWIFVKPGRRAPSIIIAEEDRYIKFAHPANYFRDDIPDVLLKLIQDGHVEGGEE